MSLSWTLFREVPWEKFSHWEKLHNSALISKVISKSFNHKIKIILKKSACVPIHNLLIIVCVCVCVYNCEVILTTTYRILGNKMQHAQSILMPLCLPVLTPWWGTYLCHSRLKWVWYQGALPLSFLPFASHLLWRTHCLIWLSCLPLRHFFTGLKKTLLLIHFMGRRHRSNCLKIENFQNKEHEFDPSLLLNRMVLYEVQH